MANRTEPGYSHRAALVTPRSGVSIPDGTGHYLIRGDVVEADSEIALANRGSFMHAPEDAERPTPTSTRTSNPTIPKVSALEDEEGSTEN